MDPDEALAAFADLGADRMIPMHFDTFVDSTDKPHEARDRLARHVLDEAPPRADGRDALRVEVYADDGRAGLGEGDGEGEPDVAEADQAHGRRPGEPLLERGRGRRHHARAPRAVIAARTPGAPPRPRARPLHP